MAHKSTTLSTDSSAPPVANDNLVSIQDNGKETQVLEINKQIRLDPGMAVVARQSEK